MTLSNTDASARPIACDPFAIAADERAAHLARARALVVDAYDERRELPDGYAWRFGAEHYADVAAYVANERRCCPFFTYTLEITPDAGPVWLRVTGDTAAKAYLASELATHAVA